jgi:hypothetical protein
MSAAMFSVFATSSMPTTPSNTGRGNRALMFAASPRPVTCPMRALISWMAAIKGSVMTTVHSMAKPNWAPACE